MTTTALKYSHLEKMESFLDYRILPDSLWPLSTYLNAGFCRITTELFHKSLKFNTISIEAIAGNYRIRQWKANKSIDIQQFKKSKNYRILPDKVKEP